MRYEVIIHPEETPNKCTIAPLADRFDFNLIRVKGASTLGPLKAQVLLHHEGESLLDLAKKLPEVDGIACVDCAWRHLDRLLMRIEKPLPGMARIPDGFLTAYPRHSRKMTDPSSGLATIEALFVASALLGNWDLSLLSAYHFGQRFIELNAEKFLALGIKEAAQAECRLDQSPKKKNSKQRRLARGKPII
jgi:ribosome biogenesis protein Tsr3